MASITCSISLSRSYQTFSSASSSRGRQNCSFLGVKGRLGSVGRPCGLREKVGKVSGGGARCWFKFGSRGMDAQGAGIYGSQSRDDFGRDDVEQYFNYMGMLAVEGTYDKMEELLSQNIHPVDILLLLAASEGDLPKIEELMRAGAKFDIEDTNGKTALDRAKNNEARDLILSLAGS